MRAMMGGSPPRSRSAKPSAVSESAVSRTSHVWSFVSGNDPPPTSENPSMSIHRRLLLDAFHQRLSSTLVCRRRPSVSILSVGISRRAVSGSRYSASVASSAASVNLSARTARASGSLLQAAIAAAFPSDDPGLRPAEQLVAARDDDVHAARHRVAQRRLAAQSPGGRDRAAARSPGRRGSPRRDARASCASVGRRRPRP